MATKSTRKITLAAPYTDADGRKHKADSTVEVEVGEASRLLFQGLAREPETKAAPAATDTKKGA